MHIYSQDIVMLFPWRWQNRKQQANYFILPSQCHSLALLDTVQIRSLSPIITALWVLAPRLQLSGFWHLEFSCSQHLTIQIISWSLAGQFPPSSPGDYYFQTQAKIAVVSLPLIQQACTDASVKQITLNSLFCIFFNHNSTYSRRKQIVCFWPGTVDLAGHAYNTMSMSITMEY